MVDMIQSLSSGMSRVSRRCSIRSFTGRLGVLDVPFARWQRLASGSVDKKVIVQDVKSGALLTTQESVIGCCVWFGTVVHSFSCLATSIVCSAGCRSPKHLVYCATCLISVVQCALHHDAKKT
jgi:hypothetical protein